MMRWICLVCLCVIVASGCATLDDYHYLVVHHHRSDQAWKQHRPGLGHHAASAHYASGWKQGYFEVSTGGTGEPPAVPPNKYWSPKYQGPAGQTAIEDWYAGFQDGATAAESEGNGAWHAIYSGPTVPTDPPLWDIPELVPAEPPSANISDQLPTPAPPIPEEHHSVTQTTPAPVVAIPVSDRSKSEQQVRPPVAEETNKPTSQPAREVPPVTSRRLQPSPSEPAPQKQLVAEREKQPSAEPKPAIEAAPVVVVAQPTSTRMAAVPRRTDCGRKPSAESVPEKSAPRVAQQTSRRMYRPEAERVVIPEVVTEEE